MTNQTKVVVPADADVVKALQERVEKLEQELILLRRAVWSNSGQTYAGWPPPNNFHQSPYFLKDNNKVGIMLCSDKEEKI